MGSSLFISSPDWQAGGLDVTQLPGQQQAHKQHHREGDAQRQGAGHFLAAFRIVLGIAFAQHEKAGTCQAGKNRQEKQGKGIGHAVHYESLCMRRKGGNLRWWLATVAMGLAVVLG